MYSVQRTVYTYMERICKSRIHSSVTQTMRIRFVRDSHGNKKQWSTNTRGQEETTVPGTGIYAMYTALLLPVPAWIISTGTVERWYTVLLRVFNGNVVLGAIQIKSNSYCMIQSTRYKY